uniref:Cytochrome P450 CYP3030A1 n=1 Tax=Tigriopus kingsejongensis TaxID=1133412 RepID=A0A2H4G2W2_9MAXI|nr:cytochrome P450 CYP3030A1 [Tigriopus kingsejongensis]
MVGAVLMVLILCLQIFKMFRGFPSSYKGNKLPPGLRWSFPLIGHLYLFKGDPIGVFMKLSQTFGGMFLINFGPSTAAIILDPDFIDQAIKEDAIPSRPLKEMESQALIRGKRNPDGSLPGIAFSDGVIWREQRKFAFQQLVNLGFGQNSSIEEVIRSESEDMIRMLKVKSEDGAISYVFTPNDFIRHALNVVWHFVSGNESPISDELLLAAKDFMKSQSPGFLSTLQLYSPTLLRLTAALGQRNMLTSRRKVDEMINQQIADHKESFDPLHVRDFIDAYLLKIRETKNPESSFYQESGEVNMRNSMFDLFIAGLDTTATTLSWAMVYMMRWPQIQTKVQEEIDRVIGDVVPSLKHRALTPYVEATLLEIQRMACIVPWLPRATVEDVVIGPYAIPKNTHVLCIIKNVTHNPSIFPQPQQFKPERFLSADGTKFEKGDRVVTFGMGKRKCPGENMARMELYMFFVSIMQNFTIESVCDPEEIPLRGNLGLVDEPQPCEARIQTRCR